MQASIQKLMTDMESRRFFSLDQRRGQTADVGSFELSNASELVSHDSLPGLAENGIGLILFYRSRGTVIDPSGQSTCRGDFFQRNTTGTQRENLVYGRCGCLGGYRGRLLAPDGCRFCVEPGGTETQARIAKASSGNLA